MPDFHSKLKELSPRRKEVLQRWLAGQTDRQIAAELVITEGTVRKHFESLIKLFLGSRPYPDNRSRRDELKDLFRQQRPDMVAGFVEQPLPINPVQTVTSQTFWTAGRPGIHHEDTLVNPYDPWTPVGTNRFVGRQRLLRRLQIALEDRHSVSIVGDWRIGKTSVLKAWVKQLEKRGRFVKFVSGEEAAGASQEAFVSTITERPLTTSDADTAANVLLRWAQDVALPNIPPVIIVDETDGLISRSEYRFFERLRAMLGQVLFVLASHQKLVEVFEEVMGKTSPFTNRLQELQLGLLEPNEAATIISWGTYIFQAKGAQLLQTWAGQHPFYLQLLGRYLVEACHEGQPFDDALDRFMNEAFSRLHSQWRVLSQREQEDLYEHIRTGQPVLRRSLRMRGMVTSQGEPFGQLLTEWLREQK
ncbi:MAG: LuxR C-terminal-related transcriptional regulator [Cyanobacteria bacterium P01_D01_bin.44]